ncbi:hypothetical protein EB796_013146 [Bugula neritina]|uniref:C-type lectin domain-containing protein n=1 Tax=Bugula neritina TaxID=10212 RepID=A0A7J7JSW3_BUGNE|nr:hypothetical protein EB796_013146 [Bugula neritina]
MATCGHIFAAATIFLTFSILTSESVKDPCPSRYEHNPFSNTCVRLIETQKDWRSAKGYCESAGETLLVLDTLESINWFKTLRTLNKKWRETHGVWLAGYNDHQVWSGMVGKHMTSTFPTI